MRKLFLLFFAFLSLQTAYAQSKIGIKFSPTLSTNRINFSSEGGRYSVNPNGVGGRFIFGPVFDLFVTENYYFSTGLLYAPKRIGISVTDTRFPNNSSEQVYQLQYLQLPASLKLFTNELALDTRVYFQIGGSLDAKIASSTKDNYDIQYIDRTRLFDFTVQLGTGVEYRLGYNTLLFGGFFYNRGLVNAVTHTAAEGLDINVKNDLVGLELGVKF